MNKKVWKLDFSENFELFFSFSPNWFQICFWILWQIQNDFLEKLNLERKKFFLEFSFQRFSLQFFSVRFIEVCFVTRVSLQIRIFGWLQNFSLEFMIFASLQKFPLQFRIFTSEQDFYFSSENFICISEISYVETSIGVSKSSNKQSNIFKIFYF